MIASLGLACGCVTILAYQIVAESTDIRIQVWKFVRSWIHQKCGGDWVYGVVLGLTGPLVSSSGAIIVAVL